MRHTATSRELWAYVRARRKWHLIPIAAALLVADALASHWLS